MPAQQRPVGTHLTRTERQLMELLCSGTDAQSAIAREQLMQAQWGGYPHAECECFLLTFAGRAGLAPIDHDGGPFAMVEVSAHGETLGFIELWVVDGYLHSVDYMPFGDDHVQIPTRETHELTFAGRG
ncbi:hypothetical protein PTQ19_04580 [Microbacterium esteraromaticum]|uniref:hypothetical protein n=1 Tax=Microbacterium esteraromaticum TaxID=57043 RepID=UPI00236850A2|nr:hypothetical protein [Microbacterium esteraromaticum]WDH79724.1 hypothetical protein PTQ19_04580 [Microbacterium esteraromaticum]